MKNILIVDDEGEIRELIRYNLEKEGFQVFTAENAQEAYTALEQNKIDLILLDVMMPQIDGIEVCRQIRSTPNNEHIIICFLTARNEDYSQIAGFDAGADDYIAKPVKPRVLISRINALLRRADKPVNSTQQIKNLAIDRDKYAVTKDGDIIHLPKKEFELLALLASRPGSVFERDLILKKVWGDDVVVGDRTIDVHIRKLREKVGEDLIKTVKGVGYKIKI